MFRALAMPLSCSLAPPVAAVCAGSWARSIVLPRATFSPAAALLQLLVVRLLAAFFVLHICGATGHCWPHAAVLAAGLCWCLDVMDCSIVIAREWVQVHHAPFVLR
jgi:hypothetical protein